MKGQRIILSFLMLGASVEQGEIEIDIIVVSCLCLSHFGCFISTYNMERAIINKWAPFELRSSGSYCILAVVP